MAAMEAGTATAAISSRPEPDWQPQKAPMLVAMAEALAAMKCYLSY